MLNPRVRLSQFSIKKSVEISPKQGNLYDLPLTETSPHYEYIVCNYLSLHNVRMSYPSAQRINNFSRKPTRNTKKPPSLLLKRKYAKNSQPYLNLSVSTNE